MKKILFGSAAAICAAIGFTSFKSATSVNTYWFSTIHNFTKATYPSVVVNTEINHPRIAIEPLGSKPAPSVGSCTGATNLCLVAFTTAQLTTNLQYLKTTSLKPSFPVFTAAYTKS